MSVKERQVLTYSRNFFKELPEKGTEWAFGGCHELPNTGGMQAERHCRQFCWKGGGLGRQREVGVPSAQCKLALNGTKPWLLVLALSPLCHICDFQ